MALMLGKFYEALRSVNVPNDKAREAAEELATYEQVKTDAYLLKWMMGVLIAMVLGVFWMQWQMVSRIAGVESVLTTVHGQLGHLDDRFAGVEGRLSGVESRLGNVESRLTGVDTRLGGIEGRLGGSEGRRSQP